MFRTAEEQQARKQLTQRHVIFWKELRADCNSKVEQIKTRIQKSAQFRTTISNLRISIATYALKQYRVIAKELEARLQVRVYDIYTAQTFNKISSRPVYNDIGRVKWHFVRRVVDALFSRDHYAKTKEFTFETKHLEACAERVHNQPQSQTFHIPKRLKTTREKACFVRAVLGTGFVDDVVVKNGDVVREIHFGSQNSPKNLREIAFDENCGSNHVDPE